MIDGTVYDTSFSSLLSNAEAEISMVNSTFSTVGSFLKQRMSTFEPDKNIYEYGVVQSFSDTIVQISGLSSCKYGELLAFEGGAYGLTMDLHMGGVGAALLGGKIETASVVHPTGAGC